MKKKAIAILGVIVLISTITFTSYSYVKVKQWDSLILPKVKIEDEDLTGKTKEEAQKIIKERYSNKVLNKKINIAVQDKTYTLDYSKLDGKYNINEAIDKAVSYGKDMSMFQKYKIISKPIEQQIKLTFTYNDKIIDEVLKGVAKDTNKKPMNATITMTGSGTFNVTKDQIGKELELEKLKSDIKSKINGELTNDVINITAPVKDIKPKVTEAMLSTIDTAISSFSTNFASSSEGRATNIDLSTKSINGTLLMPGDTFSFNDVVGERTAEKGYQSAGIIIGDKIEQGLGGGICQVSSTLYNAMLKVNADSVERYHHTFPSSYVPKGQDATVDYGNLDYKFKNTLQYPIFIEGTTYNKEITFNIYSNSSLTKRTYEIVNEVFETTEPKTETVQDPNLFEGETEIEKKAYTGYKVKVYKKIYENGKLIDTKLINNDTYNVINGVIRVGTKKKDTLAPVPKPVVPTTKPTTKPTTTQKPQ